VIYNIPAELNQSDLKELFAEFGKVLSTLVKKPIAGKDKQAAANAKGLGYVLFEHEEEANKALE
jgi:RNA recognition motif-containing protein